MAGPDVVWAGSCTSRWAAPTGIAIAVVAVCTAAAVVGEAGGAAVAPLLAPIVTCPIVLAFRRIDVTVERGSVDGGAVVVRYGVPHTRRVALAGVGSVEVIDDLQPMKWGGWGYRGGLAAFKYAGIILRRGPAIQLHLDGGRRLVITVDDAAGAAAAIEGLLPG